jgi:transcription elongation factor
MPAAVGALAVAVALSGCNDSGSGKDRAGSGTRAAASKAPESKTYRLGEASPPQESTMQASKGATYTVTPTAVRTGTTADVKKSGLQLDASDGPQVPVYVRATLAHKSGKAMAVGDMDDDLVVKTDKGQRARAVIVLMGQATWPDCPAPDTDKTLSAGQSEAICNVFLVPAGQKAAAVELTQGYYSDPLEWPVKK